MTFVTALSKTNAIIKYFIHSRSSLSRGSVRLLADINDSSKPDVKSWDPDMPLQDAVNPYEREKVKCILCEHNITVDYKNIRLLSQFVSRYTGRPYGRHVTRLCKTQQERVENEIAKAQHAGLMGTYTRDIEYANDPQLFNPDRPIRPHRF